LRKASSIRKRSRQVRVKCYAVASIFRRNLWPALAFPSMPIEFYFTPELHLRDGRIRDLDDAISFAREQRLD
jgi:hypothetical protein